MTNDLESGAQRNCRALVVDDDPFTCEVVTRGLFSFGLTQTRQATSAAAARDQIAAAGGVDLLFCDLAMPDEDGVSLLRWLAADHAGCGIVLISAVSDKLLRVVGELAAAHGLWLIGTLSKPVSHASLGQVVERWQAGRPRDAREQRAELAVDHMREAIAGGEIEVHVQPKCALDDGRLIGVEALSRWHSEHYGRVFPDAFIPFATSNGLIDQLTDHLLETTLNALASWDADLPELVAAVNIAPGTLHRIDLPEHVVSLCERHGIDVSRLVLEITEAGFIDQLSFSLDVVSRMYLAGIEMSLDDFGTGHATLSNLHQMPFSELKLDRTFVGSATEDPEAREIVHASCTLAARLNLRCVAEGVENDATVALLKSLGASAIQGYWLAPPMPIGRFVDWVHDQYPGCRRRLLDIPALA